MFFIFLLFFKLVIDARGVVYFYRSLYPILALSFDFDDTLYDNRPIIARAEEQSLLFLRNYHPILCNIRPMDYNKFRCVAYYQEPNIFHNVTHWRWRSLELMLCYAGLSKFEASSGADFAMDIIIRWRSQINISSEVHNILLELSSKWPLVAITNGNVDPVCCGLEGYFSYIFRAGRDGRSKPYEDMYCLAAKRLGLSCKNILHIGDNLIADVKGAISSGMQSCWMYEYVDGISMGVFDECIPHVKISSLLSLTNLL